MVMHSKSSAVCSASVEPQTSLQVVLKACSHLQVVLLKFREVTRGASSVAYALHVVCCFFDFTV